MQEFHEKFANHARDTFNEYEPEFDEQDWAKMKKMLPQKEEKKRPFLLWWTSGIAASLLAIITIGYVFTPTGNNFVLSEKTEIKSRIDLASKDNSYKTMMSENQNLTHNKKSYAFGNRSSNQIKSINNFESKEISSEKNKDLVTYIKNDQSIHPTQKEISDHDNYNLKQNLNHTESQLEPHLKYQNDLRKLNSDMNQSIYIISNIESIRTKDSLQKSTQSIIKESQYSKINDVLTHQDPVVFKKKSTLTDSNIVINDLLFEDSIIDISNNFIEDDTDDVNKKERWNPAFGVQVSSVSNYNSSIDPNINMGGGLMSKLPIFKKIIDIRTGLNFQKQNINNINNLLVNTDNSLGYLNNNFTSKKMDAQLLSIEIPINFAVNHEFNNKSVIFASAGFSSFTYLNEKYSYDYIERTTTSSIKTYSEEQTVQVEVQNNETVSLISNEHIFIISEPKANTIEPEIYTPPATELYDQFVIGNSTSTEYDYTFNEESGLVLNNEVNTTELKKLDEVTITVEKKVIHTDRKEETKTVESKEAAFSTFDLASMVNFSFGMSYPFGGRNTITIEPFMKIPVRKLTSRNLSYSLAGINFTYLFGRN